METLSENRCKLKELSLSADFWASVLLFKTHHPDIMVQGLVLPEHNFLRQHCPAAGSVFLQGAKGLSWEVKFGAHSQVVSRPGKTSYQLRPSSFWHSAAVDYRCSELLLIIRWQKFPADSGSSKFCSGCSSGVSYSVTQYLGISLPAGDCTPEPVLASCTVAWHGELFQTPPLRFSLPKWFPNWHHPCFVSTDSPKPPGYF